MTTKSITKQDIRKFVLKNLDTMLKKIPDKGKTAITVSKTELGTKMYADVGKHRIGFLHVKMPEIPTFGIGNIADATPNLARFPHVPFIDYDTINEWIVDEELEWLTKEYPITPFYLLYTKRNYFKEGSRYEAYWGNYHAVSLTKITFAEEQKLIEKTHSDYNYKRLPQYIRYKMRVLRVLKKKAKPAPRFLHMIPKDPKKWNLEPEVSNMHLQMLKRWYNVPDIPYKNIDKSSIDDIFVTPYRTGKP